MNTRYSNKRAPIQSDIELGNNWEASSHHAKRLKPLQLGIRSDLQPSVEDVPPTSTGQQKGQDLKDTPSFLSASKRSLLSHSQLLEGAGCPPDSMAGNESQFLSTEPPTSRAVPSILFESRQTVPQMVDGESITVEVGRDDHRNGCSYPSGINISSADENKVAAKTIIDPVDTTSNPAPSEEEQQIAWASRQVENFKADIQKLKNDAATRKKMVTSIDKDIEGSQKNYDKHLQGKQEEIARVLRELEEEYNKKCEAFKSKLEDLNTSKQAGAEEMRRNELEVSHKGMGLVRFQAIIDYYTQEDGVN